tara:strand:- start:1745 stop:2542 length:798 start_codon:yes stop_codon:yes gene_type:complete
MFFNINRIIILTLHEIPNNNFQDLKNTLNHLKLKYGFISPTELENFFLGQKMNLGIKYLLTFDDGLISNYLFAKNVLSELSISSIFFIPVKFIMLKSKNDQMDFILKNFCDGNQNSIYFNSIKKKHSMSWDNLAELINDGHTIGSHSFNHPNIKQIESEEKLKLEIIKSSDFLNDKLDVKINHFSFPTGTFKAINHKSFLMAQKHYSFIYSNIRGMNSINNKILWRDDIHAFDDSDYNLKVSLGSYHLFYFFKRLRMKLLLKLYV